MIIHFTKKSESLISILKSNKLLLKYCNEVFYNDPQKLSSKAAHPMVCFSKYNESSLGNKKITYGEYGISFKQSWVKENNIHPVVYMHNNSYVSSALEVLLKFRRETKDKLPEDVSSAIIKLKCFTKNETGFNSYAKQSDFNFKSENEWRYVPDKKKINGNLISIKVKKFKNKKDHYNNKLVDYALKFNEKDIKHIYVPENEYLKFKSEFRELAHLIKKTPWDYNDLSMKPR